MTSSTLLQKKLLPCPFCGSMPKVYSTDHDGIFEIQCYECQISTDYLPENELIKIWNRRVNIRKNFILRILGI